MSNEELTNYNSIINGEITPDEYRKYLSTLSEVEKINSLTRLAALSFFNPSYGKEARQIIRDSIDIWSIGPEDVRELLTLGDNKYYTLIDLSIRGKHYDLLWYLISMDINDEKKFYTVIKNATNSNYHRLLELLYIYYVQKYDKDIVLDHVLFEDIWYNTELIHLEYTILFICDIRKLTAKELLNTYLDKFDRNLVGGNRIVNAEKFYDAFLNVGVSLEYFREIQSINESMPLWLSKQENDI